MSRIRDIDWRRIESMSDDIELEKLEQWASEFCNLREATWAFEVGSFKGKTSAILSQFFNYVVAIDLWGNVDHGFDGENYQGIGTHHFLSFINNITQLKLVDVVYPIVATSSVAHVFGSHIRAGIVFIDGDHSYEWVKRDIYNMNHLVKPGGLLIFHDYKRPGYGYPPYNLVHPHHGPIDPWKGVADAVDEFIECCNGEFTLYEHFLGIVALKRKEK
jgi:hypothetical protein